MLAPVSLRRPAFRPMLMPSRGGLFDTNVKQEKGARLTTPFSDMDVTQAIGRGTTMPLRRRYVASGER